MHENSKNSFFTVGLRSGRVPAQRPSDREIGRLRSQLEWNEKRPTFHPGVYFPYVAKAQTDHLLQDCGFFPRGGVQNLLYARFDYAGWVGGGWGWVNCESDSLPPYMHGWGKNLQFQQNSAGTTEEKL